MLRIIAQGVLVSAVLAASPARSDPTEEVAAAQRAPPPSAIGISVGIGGGLTQFVDSNTTLHASTGGTWDVRATFGTRRLLAAEASYAGSSRNFSASGMGSGASLVGNGLEGALRAQAPYRSGEWLFEPFVFGGLGWTHMSFSGTVAPGSLVRDSADIGVVPFGAGMAIAWRQLIVEARFTYRHTFEDGLITGPDGRGTSLSNWNAGALLGFEF